MLRIKSEGKRTTNIRSSEPKVDAPTVFFSKPKKRALKVPFLSNTIPKADDFSPQGGLCVGKGASYSPGVYALDMTPLR